VRRTPSDADRRTIFVALTPDGLATFERLAADHERAVGRVFAHLSEADLDALTDILKRMGPQP
jgi:DNA-binding MarR family transcriptional regulator